MKLDEEFLHDRDHSFLTDDEENQAELACSDDEHDGDDDGRRGGANSDSSSPLSRDRSDNNLSDVSNPPWPQSYRYKLILCFFLYSNSLGLQQFRHFSDEFVSDNQWICCPE